MIEIGVVDGLALLMVNRCLMATRLTVNLETTADQPPTRLEFVGGPHPYLWVGENDGRCYGTVEITPKVRRLAEKIMEADLVQQP